MKHWTTHHEDNGAWAVECVCGWHDMAATRPGAVEVCLAHKASAPVEAPPMPQTSISPVADEYAKARKDTEWIRATGWPFWRKIEPEVDERAAERAEWVAIVARLGHSNDTEQIDPWTEDDDSDRCPSF